MNVSVYITTHGKIRMVTIPDNTPSENILEAVFHNGQNDIKPLKCPSVSVGDLVILNESIHIVKGIGFEEVKEEHLPLFKQALEDTIKETVTPYVIFDELSEKIYGCDFFTYTHFK